MKLQKSKQLITIGTAVSLALLLAAGNVSAGGKGNNSPNQNIPGEEKQYGASIGVSNVCELSADKRELLVHTTIINKSSGTETPNFAEGTVTGQWKGRGKPQWSQIHNDSDDTTDPTNPMPITPVYADPIADITTHIALCAGKISLVPSEATALNAAVSIIVTNSNNTYTSSKCGDDGNPDTDNKVYAAYVYCAAN